MKSYSLRLRLLVGAAIAIFLALATAWIAMTLLFARHIDRRVEMELEREATELVAGLNVDRMGEVIVRDPPRDHRFSMPASGIYWQVSDSDDIVRSRSLWDQELQRNNSIGMAEWTTRLTHGPFERTIIIVERRIKVSARGETVLVQLAQDAHDLHVARMEFGRELAAFLVLLWVVLSLAAWAQVSIGLRSLKRLGANVLTLKRHPEKRLLDHYPSEIRPLTNAINALADAREADVRRARQRAADLAHALKTPIAALTAQSRLLGEGGGKCHEGFDRAIASVTAAVDGELARARAAMARQTVRRQKADPALVARRLISVLERTDQGMRIDFEVDFPGGFRLPIDESDLTEIMGALLENAVRFARRVVHVSGASVGNGDVIRIDDDGPGLQPHEAERVLERGIRLDERGGGHGLGISIARELADATDGSLRLFRAELGGLRAELVWAG